MLKGLSNSKGAVAVLTAILIAVLMGFVALGTDVGYIYTVRSQMQNAVDSSAMAGAAYLYLSDRTQAVTQATAAAIDYASKNKAGNTPVVITSQDIEFFPAPPANPTKIKVTARRTSATNNPVTTIFPIKFVSFSHIERRSVDVTATATAALKSVKAVGGLRPWAVRDKWVDNNGDGNVDNGEYVGYTDADLGQQVILKYGADNGRPLPQWFNPVDLPPLNKGTPITGADAYRELIEHGYNDVVSIGDRLQIETGNMTGPTEEGVRHLINDDPYAYWNGAKVAGSAYPEMKSPRTIKIAFYNPNDLPSGGQNGYVTIIKFGAFFLEGINVPGGEGGASDNVMGRFIKLITNDVPGNEFPSFLVNVSLVE